MIEKGYEFVQTSIVVELKDQVIRIGKLENRKELRKRHAVKELV